MRLFPSILSADFRVLGDQLKIIKAEGIKDLHFDVMDGHFVEQISFGQPVIKCLEDSGFYLDVHLMITNPCNQIESFAKAGAAGISFHIEVADDVSELINRIHKLGIDAGISINPETDVKTVIPYLDKIERINIMGVHPGYGGQILIEDSIDKVRFLKNYRTDNNLSFEIEIDGGVNKDNASMLYEAGVDNLVAGSATFEGDIRDNCLFFKAFA